jgi:CheY-like chemotaxis protein/anti-sigma regulatory factor (Ser/Thr protein kinase)
MAGLLESTAGPRITLDLELGDRLPCAVADANQLEMALLNLTLNARDAMPDGGTLTLQVVASPDRRSVCIRVTDTGHGMDEATLARAVEPFFSTKGIGQGTGLGLSMVHGLALQLGGRLDIESSPGEGTTIDLSLPATERSGDTEPASSARTTAQQGSGTAILVDDEELVRASVSEMLADLGFTVVEASSAAQALKLLDEGVKPSLLVTDHLMPGMTGGELIAAGRTRLPGLRVLLISGYAEADGIPAGVPRLSKPFRAADLEAALARVSPPWSA